MEKSWNLKLNLGEALLVELEEINKRQVENGLQPIGTHVSKHIDSMFLCYRLKKALNVNSRTGESDNL